MKKNPKVTKSKPIYNFNGEIVGSVFIEDGVVTEASAHGVYLTSFVGKFYTDAELSDERCFVVAI